MTRLQHDIVHQLGSAELDDAAAAQLVAQLLSQHRAAQLLEHPADDNPLGIPSIPGYCYLCLFAPEARPAEARLIGKYPVRSRVESRLQDSAARPATGFFRVTFGTPASCKLSQKLQAHVEEAQPGTSLLRARDVLQCMPFGSRFGDGTPATERVDYTPPPAGFDPNVPVPGIPAVLGSIPDPTTRRFMYSAWTVDAGNAPGAWTGLQIDPLAGGPIASFCAFSQYVAFDRLTIRLVPLPEASENFTNLNTAWYPSHETAPAGQANYERSPTHSVHVVAPVFPGGAVQTLELECPMSYGIQRVVKPAPHFGGSPRLAIRSQVIPMATHPYPQGLTVFRVYVEAVVSIRHPSQF